MVYDFIFFVITRINAVTSVNEHFKCKYCKFHDYYDNYSEKFLRNND